MPREIVRSTDLAGDFVAKVGWSAGATVQLGVETDDGRSLFQALGAQIAAPLGQRVLETSAALDAGGVPTFEDFGRSILDILDSLARPNAGVWVDLDRAGCNRLIRLVRRARDSAYGADE